MIVLALDTTNAVGSVALVEDGVVIEERCGDKRRTHAERLPGEIAALLAAHELKVGDIDLFAVVSGPGSFTGLRIGIATIQGLAFVHRRRIVPVSALDAFAATVSDDVSAGQCVGVWTDAHRREVFSALYLDEAPPHSARLGRTLITSGTPESPTHSLPRASGAPRLYEVIEGPMVGDPVKTAERWTELAGPRGGIDVIVGDGAVMYRDVIARAFPRTRVEGAPPLAGTVGRMAVARAQAGNSVDPAGVQPLYVRRPDAELARDALRHQ